MRHFDTFIFLLLALIACLPIAGRRFLNYQIVGSGRRILPSAFPNQTYGVVQLSGLRDRATYVVSNSLGQEVATGTAVNPRIDLSRMTAGFYTITIRTISRIPSPFE